MNSPAKQHCKECDINIGCKIFDIVDERCKTYSCLYNQSNKTLLELRPDKSGIIFEKLNNELIFGLLFVDKSEISEIVYRQIQSFIQENLSVVIDYMKEEKLIVFPANNRNQKEIELIFFKERSKRIGSSKL